MEKITEELNNEYPDIETYLGYLHTFYNNPSPSDEDVVEAVKLCVGFVLSIFDISESVDVSENGVSVFPRGL